MISLVLNLGAIIYWIVIKLYLDSVQKTGSLVPFLLPGLLITLLSVGALIWALVTMDDGGIRFFNFRIDTIISRLVIIIFSVVLYTINGFTFVRVLALGF